MLQPLACCTDVGLSSGRLRERDWVLGSESPLGRFCQELALGPIICILLEMSSASSDSCLHIPATSIQRTRAVHSRCVEWCLWLGLPPP